MDFARPLIPSESAVSKSKIRYLEPVTAETAVGDSPEERARNVDLDNQVIDAANQAATALFVGGPAAAAPVTRDAAWLVDAAGYTDRSAPAAARGGCIQPGDLVVIQESFDKLDFVYVKPGDIYQNRNGAFHHDDFINQPFGTKLRSRNQQGYGFLFLLKPTPELWTRSLNHRTQVVHELDQSQIIFQLYLRPNDVVVESGTGSGAMSHAVIRSIAPAGHLHTYEFNRHRAVTARSEFQQHGLGHLVTVHHRDVCRGLVEADETMKNSAATQSAAAPSDGMPGFDMPGQSTDAVFLDLPEPWVAVPHSAFILKPNARIATYSPCVEQTQRTILAMEASGFHSIKTLEYRLQEHYVDEVEYDPPPTEKRLRPLPHNIANYQQAGAVEELGTEAYNDASETDAEVDAAAVGVGEDVEQPYTTTAAESTSDGKNGVANASTKRKKLLVARPFVMMRGHTAFLTFATAGLETQPNPNDVAAAANR